MPSPSTQKTCRSWLLERQCWPDVAQPGRGITAAVVTRFLLQPWLTDQKIAEEQTAAQLDLHEQRIIETLQLLRSTVDESVQYAQSCNAAVTITDLAQKVTRAIARWFTKEQTVNTIELKTIMSTYLANRAPAGRVVSREQFSQYTTLYQQIWETIGSVNLTRCPYTNYYLGPDEQPPLIVQHSENTWDGLARSIYSRYRMAASDAQVSGQAHTLAQREIRRSCGELGLLQNSTITLLKSILYGLVLVPGTRRHKSSQEELNDVRSWRDQTIPISGDDRGICQPAADYAEAALRTFIQREHQGRYLLWMDRLTEASSYAMRRAWMMCFEHDRRALDVDGKAAAKIITISIFKGIPSGERHWLRHRRVAAVAEEKHSVQPSVDDAAQTDFDTTLQWLYADQKRAQGVISQDPAAVALYQAQPNMVPLAELLAMIGRPAQ